MDKLLGFGFIAIVLFCLFWLHPALGVLGILFSIWAAKN